MLSVDSPGSRGSHPLVLLRSFIFIFIVHCVTFEHILKALSLVCSSLVAEQLLLLVVNIISPLPCTARFVFSCR